MLGNLTADSHIMVCWKSKSIEAGMAERSSNAVLIRLQITGTSESMLAENGTDSVCAAVAFIAGTISKTAVLLPTAASLTICPRPTAPAPPDLCRDLLLVRYRCCQLRALCRNCPCTAYNQWI